MTNTDSTNGVGSFFNLPLKVHDIHTVPKFNVYYPNILWYQVTDRIWLQFHAHLTKFGYCKYLIIIPLVSSSTISDSLLSPLKYKLNKLTWYAAEAYQKSMTGYKQYARKYGTFHHSECCSKQVKYQLYLECVLHVHVRLCKQIF